MCTAVCGGTGIQAVGGRGEGREVGRIRQSGGLKAPDKAEEGEGEGEGEEEEQVLLDVRVPT